MKFVVDAQLPPALARWMRDSGCDAVHVEDVSLREVADTAIWAYALREDAIIVTKDEDFAGRSAQVPDGPIIVWLRVGNTTNRVLLTWIAPRLSGILELVKQGSRVVEVI